MCFLWSVKKSWFFHAYISFYYSRCSDGGKGSYQSFSTKGKLETADLIDGQRSISYLFHAVCWLYGSNASKKIKAFWSNQMCPSQAVWSDSLNASQYFLFFSPCTPHYEHNDFGLKRSGGVQQKIWAEAAEMIASNDIPTPHVSPHERLCDSKF